MTAELTQKTLGQAIDEIATALQGLSEANRPIAIRAACEHLGVVFVQSPPGGSESQSGEDAPLPLQSPSTASPIHSAHANIDIRTFKLQKQPATAQEMACVVAYYLQSLAPSAARKPTVTAGDLDTYFRQGDYPLPMRLAQVLPDAKGAGYFDSAERGSYKLNPVGHNLVVHGLPRTAAVPGTNSKRPRSSAPIRKKAGSSTVKKNVTKRRRAT